jgi:pyruvate/2-oxoglutarate dehydrogenase complex dihydrolipoamide acyltransferase (E2) component
MTSTIIMPQLGETVAEGKILSWFKSVGDEVREGDNLFEVETDKVTVEVQAIVAGRLSEIRIGPGATAKVGEVVAVVGDAATTQAPPEAPAMATPPQRLLFEEVVTPTRAFGPAKGPNGVSLTPVARRLIVQNGLDVAALKAEAQRQGAKRIDGAAVRTALAAGAAASVSGTKPAAWPPSQPQLSTAAGDIVTLNAVRRKTAERIAENWRTIPHVFQAIEVDFSAIDFVRKAHKEAFKTAHGFSLTYLPFIARATCLALAAFPRINARFDGQALTLSRSINLGIAVDLDYDGLVVPVVREADDLTLIGLAKLIGRRIDKARMGKLSPDDLAGGTYTISNNGAFGTSFTAPIINAPQVAILSTDAVRLKPVVVSTPEGDFVAPRMIGTVGQSFDHRAFDGAYSAAFLSRLKQLLETRLWAEEFTSQL